MNKPRLGILAGMGAAAGAYLYSFLIKECQKRGARRDEDFPEVVLFNAPFCDVNEYGAGDVITFQALRDSASWFRLNSCERLLIACNSVHIYHEQLSAQFPRLCIANLPQLAMAECDYENSGVIASRSTKQSGLYGVGIQTTPFEQQAVDGIIRQAMAGYHSSQIQWFNDQSLIRGIISRMKKAGAEKVILGCTELRLVFPPELDEGDVIDAGEAGVRALLDGVI